MRFRRAHLAAAGLDLSGEHFFSSLLRSLRETRAMVGNTVVGEEFERVFSQHVQRLTVYAGCRLDGIQTRIDPTDVVQEVWWRAMTTDQDRRTINDFRAWLIAIARNVIREAMRSRPLHSLHASGSRAHDEIPDSITSVSSRTARSESFRNLVGSIGLLPTVDREIMIMRIGGSSYRKIAEEMDVTIHRVRATIEGFREAHGRAVSDGERLDTLLEERAEQ